MARIQFIVDYVVNESMGIMFLSSYLKANGHEVGLSLLAAHKRVEGVLAEIEAFNPDLVGFSVMTPQASTYERISRVIKEKTGRKIIWGGPHCTFMPEVVAEIGAVDIVCVGEGEEAMLTLMNRLDAGKDYADVPNLWVRKGEQWVRNEVGPLETNLDKYPFPDRELFYEKSPLMRDFAVKRFLAQRGCPFDCNYCCEPAFKKLYQGKGPLVRRHSVGYMIRQIQEEIRKHPVRRVAISDDSFNLHREWVAQFLGEYKKHIGLPFCCNLFMPNLDEELANQLKDAGCNGVLFGVESSVDRIRNDVLNKKGSKEQFRFAAGLLRKHKIRMAVNNMLCVPTQTLDDAIETLRFDRELGAYILRFYVLKIYKGTRLAKFAGERGLCQEVERYTYKSTDPLGEHKAMKRILYLGYYLYRIPGLMRLARPLLRSPLSGLLRPLILFTYWQDRAFYGLSCWEAWRLYRSFPRLFQEGMGKEETNQ